MDSRRCGRTPPDKPTGGLKRLWKWHALLPRLGLFEGNQRQIPYDYDDVLALVAPRPCLVYAPKRDRFADFAEVAACLDKAKKAWAADGCPENVTVRTPNDVNRFQSEQQAVFLEWLPKVAPR